MENQAIFSDQTVVNAKFTVPSSDVQAGTSGTITLKAQAVAVPHELIKASTDAIDSAAAALVSEQASAASESVATQKADESSGSASAALASESAADASAVASQASAVDAQSSEDDGAASASAASTSEVNAGNSEAAASASEGNSASSENAASISEGNALDSENAAKVSETTADQRAIDSDGSAVAALASEQSSQTNKLTALGYKDSASQSAATATQEATSAGSSASGAATSEANASASESASLLNKNASASSALASSNSAGESLASENAANTSAGLANDAKLAAQAARDATQTLVTQFGDQYLGDFTTDPTEDNSGNALTKGDIYFNTSNNVLKFYSGSLWVSPESIASASATKAENEAAAALVSAQQSLDRMNAAEAARATTVNAKNTAVTKAGEANADAGTASTAANTATQKAQVATDKAALATTKASEAVSAADSATSSEGAASTSATNAANSEQATANAVSNHVALPDPHTQYLKESEYEAHRSREDLLKQATLSLDFANNKYEVYEGVVDGMTQMPFNEALDFTRASSATARTATGKIQEVLTDEQRLVGNREGLLIEEQRTNLHTYSQEFTNSATWNLSSLAVEGTSHKAPDGTLTAVELIAETSSGYLITTPDIIATPPGVLYVASIWVNNVPAGTEVKAVNGDGSAVLASVTLPGDVTGWTRVSVPYTADATGFSRLLVRPNVSGVTFHVWGAQLEQGSFPTSYIPTAGTQVTRTADDCVRVLGDEYNQDEGTIYLEIPSGARNSDIPRLLFFKPINAPNFNEVFGFNISIGGYSFAGISAGNSAISSSIDAGSDSVIKLAASYKIGGDYVFAVNGQTTSGSWLTVAPLVEEIGIGNREYGHPNIAIKDFQVFPTALSEAELITLTTGN